MHPRHYPLFLTAPPTALHSTGWHAMCTSIGCCESCSKIVGIHAHPHEGMIRNAFGLRFLLSSCDISHFDTISLSHCDINVNTFQNIFAQVSIKQKKTRGLQFAVPCVFTLFQYSKAAILILLGNEGKDNPSFSSRFLIYCTMEQMVSNIFAAYNGMVDFFFIHICSLSTNDRHSNPLFVLKQN